MNLNNVESEMGFFHAYHMRAMSIASSLQINAGSANTSSSMKDDVVRSREMVDMMQSDIRTLRLQLEALCSFSYSDPFLIAEQSTESVAHIGDDCHTYCKHNFSAPLFANQASSSLIADKKILLNEQSECLRNHEMVFPLKGADPYVPSELNASKFLFYGRSESGTISNNGSQGLTTPDENRMIYGGNMVCIHSSSYCFSS